MTDPYQVGLSGTTGPHNKSYCPGNDLTGCIDGKVFRSCGHETCYGLCEFDGYCECSCHGVEKAAGN